MEENFNLKDKNIEPVKVEEGLWMVPCKLDIVSRKYLPLCKPPNSDAQASLRKPWNDKEDSELLRLIQEKGTRKWTAIANALNQALHQGKPGRLGKQCRERWYNHLNPALKKSEWTQEEDELIITQQSRIGNKWSLIAKELPGRTENSVKNRWKSIVRRNKKSINKQSQLLSSIKVEGGGEVGEGDGSYSEILPEFENSFGMRIETNYFFKSSPYNEDIDCTYYSGNESLSDLLSHHF